MGCQAFIIIFLLDSMDYLELSNTLSFAACETRCCKNVTIMDDLVNEPDEYFDYTLERTPGLDGRISLDPKDGQISIIDDDGKCSFYMIINCSLFIFHSSYYCWL